MDVFALIADERRGLADLAEKLTPAQLATPSLVPTWTVHDVIGHLAVPLEIGLGRVLLTLLTTWSLERTFDRLTWRMGERPAAELARLLRERAEHRFTPPGGGPEAPFTDLIVHGLDLRRPLGLARAIPEERRRLALTHLTGKGGAFVARPAWRDGLRLEATDLDWTCGAGPVVRGEADALMLVLTGRERALPEVSGDGVPALAARLAADLKTPRGR